MAARTLRSARNYYVKQQQLAALVLRAVRRARSRGVRDIAREVTRYQLASATLASLAVAEMLREQDISAPPVGSLAPEAFAGTTAAGANLINYLDAATATADLEVMAVQQVRDIGRIAAGVEVAQRPNLAGYVRYLNPPSCARCTILAGVFYKHSTGFARHDNCDCVMLPTNVAPSADLITDPMDAFDQGLITDLTKAETQAIKDGADMAAVVNIRRRAAGLTVAGRVLDRGGKITPEGIYQFSSNRNDAIANLIKFGYIKT